MPFPPPILTLHESARLGVGPVVLPETCLRLCPRRPVRRHQNSFRTISGTATFSTDFATQPLTQHSSKSCSVNCCSTKKPRLCGGAIKHLSCRKTQPMALITSGVLLPLIRFRSLRPKPKAAPTPRSGRGAGTGLTTATTHEPGHPA